MQESIPNRKIIHVDMDAFYASQSKWTIHCYEGNPIAVGGSENRGVVAAALSYEAFGVRSAISGVILQENCPELIFVKPRFDRYKEISSKIQKIYEYTDLVEPLSLDEAYLDVTTNKRKSKCYIGTRNKEHIF
jgi:DNA polymerase-4